MDFLLQLIFGIINRWGLERANPSLYTTFWTNVSTPGTDIQRNLIESFQTIDPAVINSNNQRYIESLLEPWIQKTLSVTEQLMKQQGNQGPSGFGYRPPNTGFGFSAVPPGFGTSTASLYDGGFGQPTSPPQAQRMPVQESYAVPTPVVQGPERNMSVSSYNHPDQIKLDLQSADTLLHVYKKGDIVSVDSYRETAFESTRVSTIDITLNTAENSVGEAVEKVLRYSPNEVIRGLYANQILYNEIVHIPIKTSEFRRITDKLSEVFYSERGRKNWREAVKVLGTLTRSEHKIFENALLQFLNPTINRFLRTSNGDVISGIEEIDDLKELDDANSRLIVTKHQRYSESLNSIVNDAFESLISTSNLIEPDDLNFGDFVHCHEIDFWYDSRSKYDYGTYPKEVDRLNFIEKMMQEHTVLRIPKKAIVTNALDPRIVDIITNYHPKDQLKMRSENNLGCKLLLELTFLSSSAIAGVERVVCVDKTPGTRLRCINVGVTLDLDHILIK